MKPIICNSESVRAILDERKSQTRRVIKDAPKGSFWERPHLDNGRWYWVANLENPSIEPKAGLVCPYGIPGDSLWVKETWALQADLDEQLKEDGLTPGQIGNEGFHVGYKADGSGVYPKANLGRWRYSIYMPRWASRITLEIKDVRVERVQDISEEDAKAEGVTSDTLFGFGYSGFPNSSLTDERNPAVKKGDLLYGLRGAFAYLWNSINAKRGYDWHKNSWVWVLNLKNAHPKYPLH